MRVIIEGCDKSGKSTLIEALKNEIPSLIGLKLLTKPKDSSDESSAYIKQMYMRMADMTRDQGAHYLFDRYYPSQMVYSFKREHDDLENGWFWEFEKQLAKTPNLYVLLDVDGKVLAQRFETDGEDYALPEDIQTIKDRYLTHFEQCQLNKLKVDPTDNIEGAIEQIKKAMEDILSVTNKDYTEGTK